MTPTTSQGTTPTKPQTDTRLARQRVVPRATRPHHRLVETYFAQDRDIVVFGSDWLSLLDALKVGGVRRHFKVLQPSIHPLPPG